uniref:F-box and leucine rich repeat protein 17 n=1 Tax=Gallus gallus TaxID=9031 RepID=A0A8V0YD36_CHICK
MAVASQCPLLQKVHVGNQDRLTDEGLKQLGSKCKELKDIHFGQCYKISDEGMIIIAKGCLKLQRIYMQENKLKIIPKTEISKWFKGIKTGVLSCFLHPSLQKELFQYCQSRSL